MTASSRRQTQQRAVLAFADGKLVCVQAIARTAQNAAYYGATPVQRSSIAACRNSPLFTGTDMPATTHASEDSVTAGCRVEASGRPDSDCACSCIDADTVYLFSNGL